MTKFYGWDQEDEARAQKLKKSEELLKYLDIPVYHRADQFIDAYPYHCGQLSNYVFVDYLYDILTDEQKLKDIITKLEKYENI